MPLQLSLVASIVVAVAVHAAPLDKQRLERIDSAVEASLKRGDCPGAVVVVIHDDEVAYRKAFGQTMLKPVEKPMVIDTVFDMASLTKPVATATSIWILIEQGKLRLSDRVIKYWPEFGAKKKDAITIEHLLLHTSGLTADNALADYQDGKAKALERIAALKPNRASASATATSASSYLAK
jgi:CubicO group peptidase (beta-lactamase class C family)